MGAGLSTSLPAAAQEADDWTDPLNLSRSGGATNPQVVVDSQGLVHVIWEDEFSGWVYNRFDGQTWSGAAVINFPFGADGLTFAVDGRGRIHAFWLDQEGVAFQSRVAADRFGDFESWSEPQVMATSALAVEVISDSRGEIHLAFIRPLQTDENPAGVYYRRSTDSGSSWALPVNVYQSPYLRSLTRTNASLDIAAAVVDEELHVYLTWDNRLRSEVFLAISQDGGASWDEPLLIDQPDPERGLATPFNLIAWADDGGAMLIWQVGEPGSSCRQYYQWSPDGGVSWGEPLPVLAQFFSCPQDNRFIASGDGNLVLMSTILDSVYLLAWNGERWSEPQAQGILRGFENPDLLTQVRLDCRQADSTPDHRLYVVGCDQAGSGDIWVTSRALADTESWLGAPPVWRSPETLAESASGFSDPVLVSDDAGNLHAFWSQIDDRTAGTGHRAIFYARWDGARWTTPGVIFSSDQEDFWRVSAAYDQEARLVASWSGRDTGNLYFSCGRPPRPCAPLIGTAPAICQPYALLAPRLLSCLAVVKESGSPMPYRSTKGAAFTWSLRTITAVPGLNRSWSSTPSKPAGRWSIDPAWPAMPTAACTPSSSVFRTWAGAVR
jgi:hypothetical protein